MSCPDRGIGAVRGAGLTAGTPAEGRLAKTPAAHVLRSRLPLPAPGDCAIFGFSFQPREVFPMGRPTTEPSATEPSAAEQSATLTDEELQEVAAGAD